MITIDDIRDYIRQNQTASVKDIIEGVPVTRDALRYLLKKNKTGVKKIRLEVKNEGICFSEKDTRLPNQKEIDFNNRLAAKIEAYWAERGHVVETSLKSVGFFSNYRGSPLSIKSTGIPTGSELR
jgi:hypothetical protein